MLRNPRTAIKLELAICRSRLPGLNARSSRMVPGDGNPVLRFGAGTQQQFGDSDEYEYYG